MAIQFYDDGSGDKILFGDSAGVGTGSIAFHEDCCCGTGTGTGTACETCDHCNGNHMSATMTVTLSGITEDGCGSCVSLNGPYVCDIQAGRGTECRWQYHFGSPVCGIGDIHVFFTSTHLFVSLFTPAPALAVSYEKALSAPHDCPALDEVLSYQFGGITDCVVTSSSSRLVGSPC